MQVEEAAGVKCPGSCLRAGPKRSRRVGEQGEKWGAGWVGVRGCFCRASQTHGSLWILSQEAWVVTRALKAHSGLLKGLRQKVLGP